MILIFLSTKNYSDVDEYGFKRPDNFDYEMYTAFVSRYMFILTKRGKRWEQLKEKDMLSRNAKMKRFVRKGIPMHLRKKVWIFYSGALNYHQENGYKYSNLQDRSENSGIVETIKIDMPRTFPDNIYFRTEDALQQQLFRVLVAFAQQNSEVGYCQGLNYIAGLLLLATKEEEATFWLLKMLVERILPQYYIKSMSGLITDLAVLDELVLKTDPEIHRHIHSVGMPWAVGATKWFICLYAEVLPTETVLRIWDCLFYEGSKILFRVALTLIKLHREQIMGARELGELVGCFKEMGRHPGVIDCHSFMSVSMFFFPRNCWFRKIFLECLQNVRISTDENHRSAKTEAQLRTAING